MKQPIIINSKISFVLVGPILSRHGIIACDQNPSNRLISSAKFVYKNAENYKLGYNKENIQGDRYSFLWSKLQYLGNRKTHLLLVIDGLSNVLSSEDINKMETALDEFILDASVELNRFVTETHYDNHNSIQSVFRWTLSDILRLIESSFYRNEVN